MTQWRYYVLTDTGVRFDLAPSPREANVCRFRNLALAHAWAPQSPWTGGETCTACHLRREPGR